MLWLSFTSINAQLIPSKLGFVFNDVFVFWLITLFVSSMISLLSRLHWAAADVSCFSASATNVSWHFGFSDDEADAFTSSLISNINNPRGLNLSLMGYRKQGLCISWVLVFTIAFRALISVFEIKNGVLPGTMAMCKFTGPHGTTKAWRASNVLRFPKRNVTSHELRYTLFFTSGCKAFNSSPMSWLPITVFVAPLSRTPSAFMDRSCAIHAVSTGGKMPILGGVTADKMSGVLSSSCECSLTRLRDLFLMRSWLARARWCDTALSPCMWKFWIRLRVFLSLSFASMDSTSTWKTTPSCRKESSKTRFPNSCRSRNSKGRPSGMSVTARPVKFDPAVDPAWPVPDVSLPLFGHSAFQWPRLPQSRQLLLRIRFWRFFRWPPHDRFNFPFDPDFPKRPFPFPDPCDDGKKPRCLNFSAKRFRASVYAEYAEANSASSWMTSDAAVSNSDTKRASSSPSAIMASTYSSSRRESSSAIKVCASSNSASSAINAVESYVRSFVPFLPVVTSWKNPAPRNRIALLTSFMDNLPEVWASELISTFFLSSGPKLEPLKTIYAWSSSRRMFLLVNSCQSTSARAK